MKLDPKKTALLTLDFQCVVLKDACCDADQEVHRVLTEKIFPAQATVLTVDAFIAEQGE